MDAGGDANKDQGPGNVAQEKLVSLQRLQIWEKLRKSELHTITKKNVADLFKVLDGEDKGEISKEDLFLLRQIPGLTLSEDDVYALADDCDKDKSGKVGPDELYQALTQGELAFSLIKESLGKTSKAIDEKALDVNKVIEFLSEEYDTSSALWSLPQTFCLFALFMLLMSVHLDVFTAYQMQGGLLNEIVGEGPPYLKDHEWAIVHDVPTMWEWLDSSFVSLHFKNYEDALDTFPYPGRVASYNQIVGGIQFKKFYSNPEPCDQGEVLSYFYDSQNGRCHRSGGVELSTDSKFLLYHEQLDYIHEAIQNWTSTHWVDQNTTALDIQTLFYNAHLKAYTDTHLEFSFLESGLVRIRINMETFIAEPYFNKAWLVPDAMFAAIIGKMLYQESRELIPAAKAGWDGLRNYAEFWNIIDWGSIFFGVWVMSAWTLICMSVSESLQLLVSDFPQEALDNEVLNNRTFLTPWNITDVSGRTRLELEDVVSALHEESSNIASSHETLRMLVFIYAFILMMKFFKAFQANPRLDIVIRTLTKSAVEIIHFLIVFGVIFLCFSCAGYVMFGRTLTGFCTQIKAAVMCWRILMGEFDLEEMEIVGGILLADLWMISFQFLVLLILLNMLLAIIMDTYVAAKAEAGEPDEQLTIWTQIIEACHTMNETRGHLPLYKLLLQLQDEDYPAHPQPTVTSKSLRRAFQKMGRHQADYIMRKTVEFMKAQAAEVDLGLVDTVRVLALLKVNILRNVDDTQQILEILKERGMESQNAAFEAIMNADSGPTITGRPGDFNMPGGAAAPGAGASGQQLAVQQRPPAGVPQRRGGVPGGGMAMGQGAGAPGGQLAVANQSASMQGSVRQRGAPSGGLGATMNLGTGNQEGLTLPPGTEEMMGMLGSIQETLGALQMEQVSMTRSVEQQLRDQKQYIEERDLWLEQRINSLERRCEKLERGSEAIYSHMQGVDFQAIAEKLTKIEKLVVESNRDLELEADSDEDSDESSTTETATAKKEKALVPLPPPDMGRRRSSLGGVGSRNVEQKLEGLNTAVQTLLGHAEESTEQRRLLWKIDLGIRQLRAEGLKVAPGSAQNRRTQGGGASVQEPGDDSADAAGGGGTEPGGQDGGRGGRRQQSMRQNIRQSMTRPGQPGPTSSQSDEDNSSPASPAMVSVPRNKRLPGLPGRLVLEGGGGARQPTPPDRDVEPER